MFGKVYSGGTYIRCYLLFTVAHILSRLWLNSLVYILLHPLYSPIEPFSFLPLIPHTLLVVLSYLSSLVSPSCVFLFMMFIVWGYPKNMALNHGFMTYLSGYVNLLSLLDVCSLHLIESTRVS